MAVEHECKNCKKLFLGRSNAKYCYMKCKNEFARTTQAYKDGQRRYWERNRVKLSRKICHNCQVEFVGVSRAKFCTRKCENQFNGRLYRSKNKDRVREKNNQYEQKNVEKRRQYHRDRSEYKKNSDCYVAGLIGLTVNKKTIELIQLAKARLMLKRVLRSKKERK